MTISGRALSGLLMALMMGVGCRDRKPQVDAKRLRIPLIDEPPSSDPHAADTGLSIFILSQVVSTLLSYDSERKIIPSDAESFEWDKSGQELKLILRRGLRWSDGVALTACQFRDGILHALDPKSGSASAELLYEIQGAYERQRGRIRGSQVGIVCDDAKGILRLRSVRPKSTKLLHSLAFIVSAPIRSDLVAKRGPKWLLPQNSQIPGVASGAFRIKEWTHGQRIVLEARQVSEPQSELPSDRRTHLDRVELPLVRDANTAFSLYESSQLDVLTEMPHSSLKELAFRPDRHISPYYTTYFIGFSLRANPVLKDPRIRRALSLAVNQDEIPSLLYGAGQAAYGMISPQMFPTEMRERQRLFNPNQARALLKEAGYSVRTRFPKLQLYYNSGERHQILMERLVHNWKRELGIDVELYPLEWKLLVTRLKERAPDLYRYAWASIYPDPLFFLELFRQKSFSNFGGWKDARYETLVESLSGVALEKRDALFWTNVERAEKILVLENPAVIPIYHYVRNTLIKPWVKGLQFDWRGQALLREVRIEIPR